MSARRQVTTTINGVRYQRTVETRLLLVDFLRHELQLTGTHVGCAGRSRLSVASRLHRASVTAATPVKPGAPKPTGDAPPRACPSATSQRGDSGTQARISKVSRAGTKPQAKSPGLSITCERRDTPKQPAENRQANAGGRLVYWSRMAGLSTIR